ncbi:hypothetical protein BX666DRAFT_982480 [Dichotomocladium elegans]|nr:hypothetical protein BX666DRAFT_982480 [Dichotomocladium elegans]
MQPNRYINELEHWRRTSQRPEPYEESSDQSPTQSPTMDASEPIGNNSQNYDPNLLEHDYTAKSPSNAFPVEAPRGWLEYSLIPPSPPHASEGSSIQGGSRVTPNKSDIANKMNRKHRPYSTDHCIGSSQSIPSTPVAADPSSSNSGTTDSQTARDMLGAVSYEDIVKLTQMTAHLPDTSLVSKYHVNRGHNRQRSEETRSTKEYMRTISAVRPPQFDDAFPDISQQQIYDDHRPRADPNPSISAENVITMEPEPIITRPSMSTPPPSSIQAPLMPRPIKPFDPLKSDRRRSWYKQLVKRDKSKLKSTDSPLPGRHAPHIPSSPYDTSLPMMKRDESPSNDMRQIPTDQQLESGLTHGGSDGVSSVDHDPEINTRKRTALRPGTFIRDRLRKASHVELNEVSSSVSHYGGRTS